MAKAIRFHEPGGPDVLRLEDVEVGTPGPGQVRLRHKAIDLNYADTYFVESRRTTGSSILTP
jgi:NADPH2:quinone reductase